MEEERLILTQVGTAQRSTSVGWFTILTTVFNLLFITEACADYSRLLVCEYNKI